MGTSPKKQQVTSIYPSIQKLRYSPGQALYPLKNAMWKRSSLGHPCRKHEDHRWRFSGPTGELQGEHQGKTHDSPWCAHDSIEGRSVAVWDHFTLGCCPLKKSLVRLYILKGGLGNWCGRGLSSIHKLKDYGWHKHHKVSKVASGMSCYVDSFCCPKNWFNSLTNDTLFTEIPKMSWLLEIMWRWPNHPPCKTVFKVVF